MASQHTDSMDQLIGSTMQQAPQILHHVFSLEGKSRSFFLPDTKHRKADRQYRSQRSSHGTEDHREQGGLPDSHHCSRAVQGQQVN